MTDPPRIYMLLDDDGKLLDYCLREEFAYLLYGNFPGHVVTYERVGSHGNRAEVGAMKERARVVDWLKTVEGERLVADWAKAIEDGEHLK